MTRAPFSRQQTASDLDRINDALLTLARLKTVKQVAFEDNVSEKTVRRAIDAGLLEVRSRQRHASTRRRADCS